jgi:ferric-dicitrate binding protein FerR (iron transport regulator)
MTAPRRDSSPEMLRQLRLPVVPVDSERRQLLEAPTVNLIAATIRRHQQRPWRRWSLVGSAALVAAAAAIWLLVGAHWPLNAPKAAPRLAKSLQAGSLGIRPPAVQALAGAVSLKQGTLHTTLANVASPASLYQQAAVTTAPDGRARISLPEGGGLLLGGSSELRLSAPQVAGRSFLLSAGHVEVDVPHRGTASPLTISTPDALVTVVGTAFSVDYHIQPAGGETVVEVSRGLVRVQAIGQSPVLLSAGGRFSSRAYQGQTSALGSPASSHAEPTAQAPSASTATVPSQDPQANSLSGASSSLPQANRLFAAALDARRAGKDARAVALFEQLLSRYPESPLAPEARAEKQRALVRLGAE